MAGTIKDILAIVVREIDQAKNEGGIDATPQEVFTACLVAMTISAWEHTRISPAQIGECMHDAMHAAFKSPAPVEARGGMWYNGERRR